jgi:hypothetical protein
MEARIMYRRLLRNAGLCNDLKETKESIDAAGWMLAAMATMDDRELYQHR